MPAHVLRSLHMLFPQRDPNAMRGKVGHPNRIVNYFSQVSIRAILILWRLVPLTVPVALRAPDHELGRACSSRLDERRELREGRPSAGFVVGASYVREIRNEGPSRALNPYSLLVMPVGTIHVATARIERSACDEVAALQPLSAEVLGHRALQAAAEVCRPGL